MLKIMIELLYFFINNNNIYMDFKKKYLKYKAKYLDFKKNESLNLKGGYSSKRGRQKNYISNDPNIMIMNNITGIDITDMAISAIDAIDDIEEKNVIVNTLQHLNTLLGTDPAFRLRIRNSPSLLQNIHDPVYVNNLRRFNNFNILIIN